MAKKMQCALAVVFALACLPSIALADEIVHFTNGAEMTVRSHVVEKEMVKLDLGSNSFISFPMSMVDKIMSAGQDVFLNPSFHPANQAVAGSAYPVNVAPDTSIRGGGGSVGLVRQPNAKGGAGVMLGEAADAIPAARADLNAEQPITSKRRIYNPAFPAVPGGMPQVIMPPAAPRPPGRMTLATPTPPPAPPPADNNAPENNPPQGDPNPEDPPHTP